MKKLMLTLVVVMAVSALMASTAQARNEFENGFKTELGAIAARSAVGLGVSIVAGAVYTEPYYVAVPRTVYIEHRVAPPPRWCGHDRPGYFHRHRPYNDHHHGHFRGPHDGPSNWRR